MYEIARRLTKNEKAGFCIVRAPAPDEGASNQWDGKPIRGSLTHLGRNSEGHDVFRLDANPEAASWALWMNGEAEPIEGAVVVHFVNERYEAATLLLIGPRAIVNAREHRGKARTVLYLDGERTECGNTESVIIALGVRRATSKPEPVPAVPAPSRAFIAALEGTMDAAPESGGADTADDGDPLADIEPCPMLDD